MSKKAVKKTTLDDLLKKENERLIAAVSEPKIPAAADSGGETFDQQLEKQAERRTHFHALVDEYAQLDVDEQWLHMAAVERAGDQGPEKNGINPNRRLTGVDRLTIARIAHGTACAYTRLTGDGHTIPWEQFDETTRMRLTTLVMTLHRLYVDPTYQYVDLEAMSKLGLNGTATGIFLDTCKMLIRVWLKESDNEYVL